MKYHRVTALAVLVTLLVGLAPIATLAQQPKSPAGSIPPGPSASSSTCSISF